MSKTVDSIRHQIDSLDDKIHDLLMRRAELVVKIGEEKRKNKVQIIQPDREAVMIRRLLARHHGPLPKEAVVRIWRELVGAVSLLQTGLKVVVNVPDAASGLIFWDMAKDYFSSVLPMLKAGNPLAALGMVREQDATFAVLPWPEDEQANPWWAYLIDESGDTGLRVMARLPLGDGSSDAPNPEHRALVVARIKYEPSGMDRSFITLDIAGDTSRGKVIDKARALGLEVVSLHTCPGIHAGRKFHLLEIEGYLRPGDAACDRLLGALEDPDGKAVVVGGYPVPPVYGDVVGRNAVAPPAAPEKKSA